ncbi:TatD family hydrolase [Cohnella nanjingensis]|uniref:TatD family hydrolase n=1 Tax=Cohnella nanjingensis TaxID=1387779 RepID=A0A7X0VJE6_9BACL|nr:TatD family hydrolase [Cohnella nanjingensis]MBB6675503.1 TatD family hydrolase [Cohnella nanjingensis]
MAYDAHLHLDGYPEARRESLLAEAFAAGVAGVVAVSMDASSCAVNRAWASRHPGRVMPAYGHHPEQSALNEAALDALCAWIRARDAVGEPFAIGEVGLPYYTRTEAEERGEAFDEAPYVRQLDRFAALAAELDRPIALHAVYEDADKALDILARRGVRRAHFHWFKGSPATVARLIAEGYYVSVTPDVAYEQEIRTLASVVPLDRLMAETDGPWPFEGPYAGRETHPAMTADVAAEIARLRGLTTEAVGRILDANARAFYGFE